MFSFIWHTFFYDPVYNGLVFFIDIFPSGDVGLAIIATVIVVKVILFPLSIKAVKTQKLMRELEPKLKELKETYKDNREEQAKAMMALYKEAGMNPFASILLIFIQLPFIISLYLSVMSIVEYQALAMADISLPDVNVDILYSFVAVPATITMDFLGTIDISGRSVLLAALAAITQYIHTKLAMPDMAPRDPNAAPDFKDDFMRNMQLQMRYVLPVIIFVVAYTFSAAIALYFLISNVVTIAQEYFVRKHR